MQWARFLHWEPFVHITQSESIWWACDHLSVLFQWELGHVLVAEALVFFKMQSIPVNPRSGSWEHRC